MKQSRLILFYGKYSLLQNVSAKQYKTVHLKRDLDQIKVLRIMIQVNSFHIRCNRLK